MLLGGAADATRVEDTGGCLGRADLRTASRRRAVWRPALDAPLRATKGSSTRSMEGSNSTLPRVVRCVRCVFWPCPVSCNFVCDVSVI